MNKQQQQQCSQQSSPAFLSLGLAGLPTRGVGQGRTEEIQVSEFKGSFPASMLSLIDTGARACKQ